MAGKGGRWAEHVPGIALLVARVYVGYWFL